MKTDLIDIFFAKTELAKLGAPQRRLVVALRQCVLHGKARACPMKMIVPLLGGPAPAKQFLRIVRAIGDAWPEPVQIYRPCSQGLTYDERLLIEMIDRAVHRDIAGFDGLLDEMLNQDARSRVLGEILAFVSAYIDRPPRHAV